MLCQRHIIFSFLDTNWCTEDRQTRLHIFPFFFEFCKSQFSTAPLPATQDLLTINQKAPGKVLAVLKEASRTEGRSEIGQVDQEILKFPAWEGCTVNLTWDWRQQATREAHRGNSKLTGAIKIEAMAPEQQKFGRVRGLHRPVSRASQAFTLGEQPESRRCPDPSVRAFP